MLLGLVAMLVAGCAPSEPDPQRVKQDIESMSKGGRVGASTSVSRS